MYVYANSNKRYYCVVPDVFRCCLKVKTWLKILMTFSLIVSSFGLNSALLIQPGLVSAEPYVYEQKTYGGPGMEHSNYAISTSDGGFIVVVISGSRSSLIKIDDLGNKLWEKPIDVTSPGEVWCNSIQQTPDGGYILAGEIDTQTLGFLGYNREILLLKTDKSGNQQWYKTLGTNTKDAAYSVQLTSDGGYIIAGSTEVQGTTIKNSYLIKTDASGNKIWERSFGGNLDNTAYSVKVTQEGAYILTGYISTLNTKWDIYLIKVDSSGTQVWEKTIGGAKKEASYAIQLASDGGYIIAALTESYGAGGQDFYLVKTDSSGNKQWEKTFGGTRDDLIRSLQVLPDGGYLLAGQTLSYGAGTWNALIIKTDSSGNKVLDKAFGAESEDTAIYAGVTTDGGYMIIGDTNSFGAGLTDVYVVRVYDLGQIIENLKTGVKEQDDNLRILQEGIKTGFNAQISELKTSLQTTDSRIIKLQSDLQISNNQIKDLELARTDLQSALEAANKMNTLAIGIGVIAVIIAIISIFQQRKMVKPPL
jgi:hypothetical protein